MDQSKETIRAFPLVDYKNRQHGEILYLFCFKFVVLVRKTFSWPSPGIEQLSSTCGFWRQLGLTQHTRCLLGSTMWCEEGAWEKDISRWKWEIFIKMQPITFCFLEMPCTYFQRLSIMSRHAYWPKNKILLLADRVSSK